jgi:hypothetical protein
MTELCAGCVVRDGTGLARYALDLLGWNEQKFGLAIDERTDEPWACHPVHFHVRARYPFHGVSPFGICTMISTNKD